MGIDLSVIWLVIIVFAALVYIAMGGFDLGIGVLFPAIQDANDRDVMVSSVAPVWDGNETWLILGGTGLFDVFPLAYAVVVDALTIPLTLMLIGLTFHGVAFEFRFKATPAHRPSWDKALIGGSILATFTQDIVVGAVLNGFSVTGCSYSGGPFDWLTPFTLFCGIGLVTACALLGATWLVMKSESPLQDKMRSMAEKPLLAMLVVTAIISLWTPPAHSTIVECWFSLPNLWFLMSVLLLVTLISLWLWRSSGQRSCHTLPFVLTLGLIFLGFSGLRISIWPYIIPPPVTLWQATVPAQSQGFILVGALLIIPITLVCTFWNYYILRGKVQHGEGYH